MKDDSREILALNELLEEIRSISSHKKLKYISNMDQASVGDISQKNGIPPLIIQEENYERAMQILQEIESATQTLDRQITNAEGRNQPRAQDSRSLELGKLCLERKDIPILRGSLRLVYCRPIISHVSTSTAQFIQEVGKIHVIIRENHGTWGYHFHYCDTKKRRSDTILRFMQNLNNNGKKVVFHEVHANGKSDFLARVDLWSRKLNESAYDSCLIGLGKFKFADFKKPGVSANKLWPVP